MKNKIITSFIFIFSYFTIGFLSPVYANHPPYAANSKFSVSSSSSNQIPADGTTTANITIVLHDSDNNPCVGDSINLTSSNDNTALFYPSFQSSDNSGQVSFAMTSTNIGTTQINVFDSTVNATLSNFGQVTFVQAPSVTPTPSPTPLCNDAMPGSSPQLLTAVQNGSGKVVLTWKLASDPVTYYLVSYGIASGQYIYGAPNVGGQGTTSFTVNSLSNGKKYYFAVKAINGCKSSDYSNELSFTLGASTVSKSPVTTKETDTPTPDQVTPTLMVTDTPIQTPTLVPQKSFFDNISDTNKIIGSITGVGIIILVVGGFLYFRAKN